MFQILLGDTIVLWRTFAVWENRPWALSVPCALWLIALGTFLSNLLRHELLSKQLSSR